MSMQHCPLQYHDAQSLARMIHDGCAGLQSLVVFAICFLRHQKCQTQIINVTTCDQRKKSKETLLIKVDIAFW